MIRFVPACAAVMTLSLATQAAAQEVPSSTGAITRAPRAVAKGGATVETAPAARTKARVGRRTRSGGTGGTASTGANGADAMSGSGSAAPGGPGSPPPTLPVGPGTEPMSKPGQGPGPGAFELTSVSYSRA